MPFYHRKVPFCQATLGMCEKFLVFGHRCKWWHPDQFWYPGKAFLSSPILFWFSDFSHLLFFHLLTSSFHPLPHQPRPSQLAYFTTSSTNSMGKSTLSWTNDHCYWICYVTLFSLWKRSNPNHQARWCRRETIKRFAVLYEKVDFVNLACFSPFIGSFITFSND